MGETKEGWTSILRGKKQTIKKYAFVTLLYLIIALVMFYPITLHMGSVAPGSGGNTYQNLWDIWWVKYAVLDLHTSIYYTNMLFWPLGVNLVYQTMSPLAALISAPLQALGVVFAYNVIFLVGFALSGAAMFLLADYLTENRGAAFIAGLVFTFSTFHIAQAYAHLIFINIEFVPLFLYFLIRAMKERWSYTNIVGMSASFALAALMGNIEQNMMLLILLFLVAAIYAINKPTRPSVISRRFAFSIALFAVMAFVIGAWVFVPLANSVLKQGGLATANVMNTLEADGMLSHDLLSFFVPSYFNGVFSAISTIPSIYNTFFAPDPPERVAYIGFTVIALALYGLYRNRRREALWLVLAVIFGWLTLGPHIQIAGIATIPGIYYLYHLLPAINIVREPGRFDLIFTMMMSILAAYGAKALMERLGRERRDMKYMAVIALSLLILIESNGMPLGSVISSSVATNVMPSHLYSELSNTLPSNTLPSNFSVVQLPALPQGNASQLYLGEATYYTSISHWPLVGGYVTRENLTDELLLYNMPLIVQAAGKIYQSPVNEDYTNQTLMTLSNYRTAFVIVTKDAYNSTMLAQLDDYLSTVFGSPVYNDSTTIAFQTSKAVSGSLFKSYVAYPIITQWQETEIAFNGTYIPVWVPSSPGAIAVFAPYANNSTSSGQSQAVNTTISFYAIAGRASPLEVYVKTPAGESMTQLNITNKMRRYTVKAALLPGLRGNTAFFNESPAYPVFISNITFSREV